MVDVLLIPCVMLLLVLFLFIYIYYIVIVVSGAVFHACCGWLTKRLTCSQVIAWYFIIMSDYESALN